MFDEFNRDRESETRASVLDVQQPAPVLDAERVPEEISSLWAWSSPTQASIASFRSSPHSFILDREQATMPGVVELFSGDPVQELLSKYTNVKINRALSDTTVPHDEQGLQMLVANENFRAALESTEHILTSMNQGRGMAGHISKNSVKSLRVWHLRFILFAKLKMYSAIEAEIEYFGNFERTDLSFEYYPHLYPDKRGSMVPFSLRLLWAQLPGYSGKYNESLDRLTFLLVSVRKLLDFLSKGCDANGTPTNDEKFNKQALTYWQRKEIELLYSICNCFVLWMDYSSAFEILEEVKSKITDFDERVHLISGIGRAHLQLGDLKKASAVFRDLETYIAETKPNFLAENEGSAMEYNHVLLMNRALLLLCQNKYKDAVSLFEQITIENNSNVIAWNNLAVTNMYLGRMRDAMAALENVIKQSPGARKNTCEAVIQNLSLLYGNETPKSLGKKILLLEHVAKVKGDAFKTECLRFS